MLSVLYKMSDRQFVIKVADLLQQPGKIDEIPFTEKFTDQLPNLQEKGISGTLMLQSMDGNTVLATLKDICCVLTDTCDISLQSYDRKVVVDEYVARFMVPDVALEEDTIDDEVFPIDPSHETINIEDMLVQSIKLQEPLVKRAPGYEKVSDDAVDADAEPDYLESHDNVIIHS